MCPLTPDELSYLELLIPYASESELDRIQELLTGITRTEAAEQSLHEFVKQAWGIVEPDRPFIDGWHIRAMCLHLEAVTKGLINNLLINVPPGHCKSLLTCVFWPAWEWTTNPSVRWFFASYDQPLATRDSVKCRYVVESPWYQERWGKKFGIVDDQNQKTRFDTTERGWRLATSVDGRGTGEHPDRIVVDDPHNVRQSDSDAKRQSALDWWDGTIGTRGKVRGARRVVIMQRLHEADLSGHILEKGGFDHICLPLEFEHDRMKPTSIGWQDPRTVEGEYLWPEAFTPQIVEEVKRDLGSHRSAGQLQQRPTAREGGMFKREWFQIVDAAPREMTRLVRWWDKAGTDDDGDYTAGVLMGEHKGIYYIIDIIRGQWSYGRRDDLIDLTASVDYTEWDGKVTIWMEQEPGSGGKQSAEISKSRLSGYPVHAEPSTGSKEVNAEPFASQCEAGNVRLVRGPWNGKFLDEATVFPNGKNDDQIEGAAKAFKKLARPGRKLLVG